MNATATARDESYEAEVSHLAQTLASREGKIDKLEAEVKEQGSTSAQQKVLDEAATVGDRYREALATQAALVGEVSHLQRAYVDALTKIKALEGKLGATEDVQLAQGGSTGASDGATFAITAGSAALLGAAAFLIFRTKAHFKAGGEKAGADAYLIQH